MSDVILCFCGSFKTFHATVRHDDCIWSTILCVNIQYFLVFFTLHLQFGLNLRIYPVFCITVKGANAPHLPPSTLNLMTLVSRLHLFYQYKLE